MTIPRRDQHALSILQVLCVRWSKASRGAPAAQRRNAVAETFRLPEVPSPHERTRIVWQEVVFDERCGFEPHETVRGLSETRRNVNALTIAFSDTSLSLSLPNGRGLVLMPGEYGRVVFNIRTDAPRDRGGLRTYEKFCVNAAVELELELDAEFFTRRSPDREIRVLRDLR